MNTIKTEGGKKGRDRALSHPPFATHGPQDLVFESCRQGSSVPCDPISGGWWQLHLQTPASCRLLSASSRRPPAHRRVPVREGRPGSHGGTGGSPAAYTTAQQTGNSLWQPLITRITGQEMEAESRFMWLVWKRALGVFSRELVVFVFVFLFNHLWLVAVLFAISCFIEVNVSWISRTIPLRFSLRVLKKFESNS